MWSWELLNDLNVKIWCADDTVFMRFYVTSIRYCITFLFCTVLTRYTLLTIIFFNCSFIFAELVRMLRLLWICSRCSWMVLLSNSRSIVFFLFQQYRLYSDKQSMHIRMLPMPVSFLSTKFVSAMWIK